jgi:D-arabinose 1-dehydrogenase-like Zn-dependent alcohol dehydrogenase
VGTEPVSEILRAWDAGADIVLQVAPSLESANTTLPGLSPDGTFVVFAPVPVVADCFMPCLRRQRLMGSVSRSRGELQRDP